MFPEITTAPPQTKASQCIHIKNKPTHPPLMWSKPIGRKSVLGMAVSLLHLLVIILGLSQFASLDAVPISRTRDLSHGYKGYQVSETTRLVITGETWKKLSIGVGRKNIEINDYPEFGANNRHQRGCFEC